MLRSFGYAPGVVAMTSFQADSPNEADQQAYRATEWADRNRTAFLDAYVGGRDLEPDELVLLRAYEADKAVYEAKRGGRDGVVAAGQSRARKPRLHEVRAVGQALSDGDKPD